MAFQAMNHGLKARAVSPPRTKVTHNPKADSVRVLGPSQIVGNPALHRHPRKSGDPNPRSSTRPVDPRFCGDDGGAGQRSPRHDSINTGGGFHTRDS